VVAHFSILVYAGKIILEDTNASQRPQRIVVLSKLVLNEFANRNTADSPFTEKSEIPALNPPLAAIFDLFEENTWYSGGHLALSLEG